MKNIGYLECQRGGYHAGQFLNIVCLNPSCKNDPLCCCACIQEMHVNHKTKTLKKLLIDAETLSKNFKQQSKPKDNNINTKINTDIMANMVQNEQKNIISRLHDIKTKFVKQIDDLQGCIHSYYKSLYQQLNKQVQKVTKDPKLQLLESIQKIQGSGSQQTLKQNVLKLISNINAIQKLSNGTNQDNEPDEQSYFNFLKNSNIDISNIVQLRISDLYKKLSRQVVKMKKINEKISSFWSNKLFKFSQIAHHDSISLLNPFTIRANIDAKYQMAVMNPGLTFNEGVQTFTFRINANDLQWVGVGVCYKNIAQKYGYEFNFADQGHGCYMVSGNAGTWSHSNSEFNNKVKAFTFKPGDSITCTVTKTKISFIKNTVPQFQQALQHSQKQYYELEIQPQADDTLHPCVVCFYQNTEVQYLPSFKNLQLELPKYSFKFNQKTKHHDLIVQNQNHLIGCHPTAYKSCILDNPIEQVGAGIESRSVTFRIVRSTGSWIGIGVCHKNIVIQKKYDFFFQSTGHGCYMVSANGGSWSNINANENNLVRTFKFVEGDLITVSLDQKNKKVLFKKGIQKYELKYNPVQGDPLYPIVVMYYPDDEVDVLPDV